MCHFITATLPHVVKPDSVAPIFESHKLGFELISNPHVAEQVDSQDWFVLTSRKHCDCGTSFGSLNHQDAAKAPSYDRELNRVRKKGWSEAKIQRWLEQKEHTKERHLAEGGGPELDRWIEFLNELIRSGLLPEWGYCCIGIVEVLRVSASGFSDVRGSGSPKSIQSGS
jgi:hypothetical protein